MLGRDEKMQPGFVHFSNFAQGFGFASWESLSDSREFSKTHKVGFCKSCGTGVDRETYNHKESTIFLANPKCRPQPLKQKMKFVLTSSMN